MACVSMDRASAADAPAKRPHVLLIMTDDMGWMDLHCQGNDVLRTPNIDRFAKQGVRFTHAYAAAPVCSPTRAALITGLAPARLHITQHGADTKQFWPEDRTIQPPPSDNTLPHERVTLAERLKAAGYATGFFGKWHLGEKEFYPDTQGFDVNVGGCNKGGPPTYFDPYRIPTLKDRKEGEYLSDRLADETIQWMGQQGDSPMFICLWTYNPHYPFEAPEALTANYNGKEGPGLKNPIYGGQIEATDVAVGRVLGALDEMGIADETLVIFTSDNGGWSGATDNRPLREGKGFLYEGGIRVPLMVRWPGVTEAGKEDDTPVISMDLTATILDATGVDLEEGETLDGETLRPLFGDGALERDALCWNYPHWSFHKENRPGAAIRVGDHKLIRRYDDGSLELFDVVADIAEKNDLAKAKPDLAKKLNARLQRWLEETDAGIPTPRKPVTGSGG
ncbi:N-acetylgalactosamine-6-sulfatase [Haloferula helveola]|uniref:N-acetylgalactosamine-6-sulfatase n=1 Tax=Haloferula helveola TaxID=490095 RepID=A0ABM7RGB4_9BACT|nr:N-acetylgalactosamine-6-sulfatase [Haloferula helveola]